MEDNLFGDNDLEREWCIDASAVGRTESAILRGRSGEVGEANQLECNVQAFRF